MKIYAPRFRDFRFVCAEDDLSALYGICFGGSWEPLLSRLSSEDVLIDAGANVGAFSVLASRRVSKVIAVEPEPMNFALLKENIRLNHLSNVFPVKAALTDRVGRGFMCGDGLKGHLSESGTPVAVTTLDALVKSLGCTVTAIKMDIEGQELLALESQKALDDVHSIGVETDFTFLPVSAYLREKGFTHQGTYPALSSKMKVLKRAASLDLIYDELSAGFYVTKDLVSRILTRRFDPLVPLRGNENIQMLFAFRPRPSH